LTPGDARAAGAEKALIAANPHLVGNLAALPAGTPIIVPAVPGLVSQSSAVVDPKQAALMSVLSSLLDSAHGASNAQGTGSATTPPPVANPQRDQALALLNDDLAAFKKIHMG
jgi:hypothetical protein